jgi:hypothetical protein
MKLNSLYSELLSEALTYRNSVNQVNEINLPNLRLPKNVALSNEEMNKISKLSYQDLIINQGDFDGKIVNMLITLPWKSEVNGGAIIVDIQIVNEVLYQIHIQLAESLKSIGLGYKIYLALINDMGHLYSGKGRVHNNTEIPKIWDKLNNEPNFECYSNENGNICILSNNPNKENLLRVSGN